jgi:CheY-like chemotaxis protein
MLPGATNDARRRAIEASMGNAVGRGSRLTRQLLAFARQQSLAPAPLDLARHLTETADLLTQSLRGDVTLQVEVADGTWPVLVDRTQLEVALLNLAVNARDAMPTGGSLRITASNMPAGPGATEPLEGAFVRIAVTDTGAGMSDEVLSRAFEPFFTTKDASRGSGLGLSQVWGFAQQSGGAARIDSAPGSGTTVSLLLPRAAGPALADEGLPAVLPSREDARMASVLLVEDDTDVAEMLSEVLQSLGHTVRHVATGSAALAAVEAGPRPDLVITDMMMPGGLSGLALAQELRVRMPDLPVVLATGYSERAAEFRAAGLPVLRKPFRAAELQEAMHQAMQGAGPD